MRPIAVLLLSILAACSTIDYGRAPPDDFPTLEIAYRSGVMEHCPFLALACAHFYFDDNLCLVTLPQEPAAWIVRHERAHCRGYDHDGATDVQDLWMEFRRMHGPE